MGIRYSEVFYSFQGEAELAGVPAVWLRFFGCNLECAGFGQKDPTDPSTYVLPYQDFDLTNITKNEQLPVWQTGCDSSYSWSKKYRHLAHDSTAEELAQIMIDKNKSEHNPKGLFKHPVTGQHTMVCFTGGEPMLYQKHIIDILRAMDKLNNMPEIVTIETNATRPLTDELSKFIKGEFHWIGGKRWHWAMSPKLFTVSGERNRIIPDIITSYAGMQRINPEIDFQGRTGTYITSVLKFVCNGSELNWRELGAAVAAIKVIVDEANLNETSRWQRPGMSNLPPVWVMPVGARAEEQTPAFLGPLCIEAMRRGYNVATRNQVAVFGNVIGS